MSFPAGIVRVFSGSMAPPVLSFRLLNAGAIEQFLPNAELLYRCGHAVAPWRGDARAGWQPAVQRGGAGIGVQGVPRCMQGPWELVDAGMVSWYWGAGGAWRDAATLGGGGCGEGELVLGYRGCLEGCRDLGSWWVQ